jgi:hypothetical protein
MHSMLTLIGSIMIGGLFLMNLLGFHSELRDHSYKHTNELIVQQNAMEVIDLLEWDFRKIGLGIDFPALAVYDSNRIAYYVDLGFDGVIDTVRYQISDTTAASSTPNPRDRIFYRVSNSEPNIDAAMGVTDFRLTYFDLNGNETNDLKIIKIVEVYLEFESTIPDDDGQYARFAWREKISPPNLLPWKN